MADKTQSRQIAEWLVKELGIPFDMAPDNPPPEFLIEDLVDVWWETDGCNPDGSPVHPDVSRNDYSIMVRNEAGWPDGPQADH